MVSSSADRLGPGVGLAEIPQEQREFVAAEPPDQVGGSHVPRQRRDHGPQYRISRRVTEGVIDRLQAIDVEHNERAARVIAPDIGNRAMEFAFEAAAIEDAEQKIGIGGGLKFCDLRLRRRKLRFQAAKRGSGFGRNARSRCCASARAWSGAPPAYWLAARQAPPCGGPPCVSRPWKMTLWVSFSSSQGLPPFTKKG